MSDLLQQIRTGLSATYDFERELGAGMSRVFVAGYGLNPADFRAGAP